jgi:peptidyl-prolyl cis-trans isomerase C
MKRNAFLAALAVVLLIVLAMYAMRNANVKKLDNAEAPAATPAVTATEKTDKAEADKAGADKAPAEKPAADKATADTPAATVTDKATPAADGSKVMAKYNNGTALTKAEINERIKELSGGKMPEGKSDVEQFPKEVQENIIKGIITGKLISAEATKQNLQDDEKVKKSLETLKEQVVQQEFVARKIKESVTDAAVRARYDAFVKEQGDKEEIKASHILVTTEDEAKKVSEELKKGASFGDLAKKYSKDNNKDKGGDLGYFGRGQMVKGFEDAAYALKIGDVSAPVKTDFGWHIIKLEDRRKVSVPKFEDVKAKLEQELGQKVAQDYVENLQKGAHIEMMVK